MEIIIAIVLFASLFVGAGVKRYYRKKGENLPIGDYTLDSKAQRVISFSCLVIFDTIYGFLAPFFLVFDIYHPILDWSALSFLLTSNLLLIMQILGIGFYLLGYIIYVAGRLEIKEKFSELWQPAKLGGGFAQTGIYRRMRHPLYTGGLIFNIGLIIMFQIWFGLLLFIPPTIIMIMGAVKEEKWLIEKYGEEYKRYMKQTWRFFPKLW